MDLMTYALCKGNGGGGGGERTVVPVTFEWNADSQDYSPADVPVDVYNHPEKYDLLCTFSGGKYSFVTTMFRYGSNYTNIPMYFGIMDYEVPSNFVVTVPMPDVEVEVTPAFFGKITDKFIVTLTPTAQDLSGTMDKTVAEIYEAYQLGRKIVFRVINEGGHMDVDCTARWFANVSTYPSFNGFIIIQEGDVHMLVFAATGATDDGTVATYGTELYPLTPLS